MTLLLPPIVPFVRIVLLITGLMSSLCASFAQFLGFWRPVEVDLTETQANGLEENDLYSDDKN